jgi:GNAT superfamily N-acetyltransferase
VIAGYYTFAAASLPLTELSADEKQRLPRYALLPAGLIGRLAVDQKHQGQRLGSALIVDAPARAARAEPAIHEAFLTVELRTRGQQSRKSDLLSYRYPVYHAK